MNMFNLLAPRFIVHDYQQGEAGGAHDHRHAQGLAKPTKVVSPPKLYFFLPYALKCFAFPWDFGGYEHN